MRHYHASQMHAVWVGKYLILNDTLVTWREPVNYFQESISPESTERPGKWLSRMCHSVIKKFHFVADIQHPPPLQKK